MSAVTITPEKVAEMTAACHNIDYDHAAPLEKRHWATMWVNGSCEHVVGYGSTIWGAVQAAHAHKKEVLAEISKDDNEQD